MQCSHWTVSPNHARGKGDPCYMQLMTLVCDGQYLGQRVREREWSPGLNAEASCRSCTLLSPLYHFNDIARVLTRSKTTQGCSANNLAQLLWHLRSPQTHWSVQSINVFGLNARLKVSVSLSKWLSDSQRAPDCPYKFSFVSFPKLATSLLHTAAGRVCVCVLAEFLVFFLVFQFTQLLSWTNKCNPVNTIKERPSMCHYYISPLSVMAGLSVGRLDIWLIDRCLVCGVFLLANLRSLAWWTGE